MIRRFLCGVVMFFALQAPLSLAETSDKTRELTIGYIGSLSGVAASYGSAVLDGAKVAVDELQASGHKIKLIVEDDQSEFKQTVTAYKKLRATNKIDALITGSWWANSIVKTVERDRIPFISCETLFNKDFIKADNYFTLGGDLRDWVWAFEPLVQEKGFRSGAIVRFSSGFATTLAEEMQKLFSKDNRNFAGAIEYSDLQMNEGGTIALKLKTLSPDAVYIDAQPASFGSFMKRLSELKMNTTVFSNSVAEDSLKQGLFDPADIPGGIFFSQRATFQPEFVKKFKAKHGKDPYLNSDLGYYAAELIAQVLNDKDPVSALKSGLTVDGVPFEFDENNVYRNIKQEIYTFKDGKKEKIFD